MINDVPAGSTAEAAGLTVGDTVIEVDGVSVERLDDPAFILAGGADHDLSIRHPDGSISELRFRSPPPTFNSVYLARTAVGFLGLACALVAVWGTRRREAATFLLLAVAALILGAVPNRIASAELLFQIIRRGVGAALPFLIVRFFAIFPERDRSMRLWDLLTLTAVAASAGTVFFPDAEAWWPAVASLLRVLFVSSMIFGVILQIWRWRSAARELRIRRQIEWAALGLFVGSGAVSRVGPHSPLGRHTVRAVLVARSLSDQCDSPDLGGGAQGLPPVGSRADQPRLSFGHSGSGHRRLYLCPHQPSSAQIHRWPGLTP